MPMRRILSIVLIISGVFLLVGSIGILAFNQALASPGAEPLSLQIAGLSLSTESTGQSAVREFTNLHGKQFPISSGAMGVYGANGAVVVWVAGVPFQPLATQMVEEMRLKIEEGNSPFTPQGQRVAGGRVIFELEGMGQKHFYFQAGARVIWLAANPELAETALSQALEFYR